MDKQNLKIKIGDLEFKNPLFCGSAEHFIEEAGIKKACLLYTSPSPRDAHESRMPSSA